VSIGPNFGLELAPLVGEGAGSLIGGAKPLGVQLSASVTGVELLSFDGVVIAAFVGEGFGVEFRRGDGDAGDSGLRNGEVRGEPKERGEGLYEEDIAMVAGAVSATGAVDQRE